MNSSKTQKSTPKNLFPAIKNQNMQIQRTSSSSNRTRQSFSKPQKPNDKMSKPHDKISKPAANFTDKQKKTQPTKSIQNTKFINKIPSAFYRMNYHIIKIICDFAVQDIRDLFNLSYVNRFFQNLLYNFHPDLWIRLLMKVDPKIPIPKDQEALISLVIQKQKSQIASFYEDLLIKVEKCFEPQANTLNTPNKLLKKLDFCLEMRILYEKQEVTKMKKLTLNLDNFNSFLVRDLKEINTLDLSYSKTGTLRIELKFLSNIISKKIDFLLEIPIQQLFSQSKNTQSIFNIYYLSPCLLYFFPNDTRILNCIMSISAMTLLFRLQNYLENALQIIKKPKTKVTKKKVVMRKLKVDMERFSQETDFAIFLKLHDKKTEFFNYFNTKAFPVVLNKKEALFLLKIKEELKSDIGVKLSDGLGMQQMINNSCFFDLILNDSNGFIIVISEFIVFKEIDMEGKNEINENLDVEKEGFQGFKGEIETNQFKFTIVLVKDNLKKKNVIQEISFIVKF